MNTKDTNCTFLAQNPDPPDCINFNGQLDTLNLICPNQFYCSTSTEKSTSVSKITKTTLPTQDCQNYGFFDPTKNTCNCLFFHTSGKLCDIISNLNYFYKTFINDLLIFFDLFSKLFRY